MDSGENLIIKLGAMGDVLRTTTILNILEGPVTWVTRRVSIPLLENIPQVDEIVPFDEAARRLRGRRFGLAACLDDEADACELLDHVTYNRHVGAYLEDGCVRYTQSAAPWYDMGLVSRFGKEAADELKRKNRRCYQDFLFRMFGARFRGEEYVFGYAPRRPNRRRIGIEMRADRRWKWKRWVRYPELIERLESDGFEIEVFEQRANLRDFINDVNSCGLIVTGDTLTLHVGLALKKRVIAVFGPTSAPEIHDYGRLTKVVSPIDCICCYLRDCDVRPNCMEQITIDRLYREVLRATGEIW